MSDRLSDEQVAYYSTPRYVFYSSHSVAKLAREVQESRRIMAAISALPDPTPMLVSAIKSGEHWSATMELEVLTWRCRVKAMLDGES